MASLEVGAQAVTVLPAVSAADVKITKAAVLPCIREAADQFAKTKSATVDQITESLEKINEALETINDKLRQSSTSLALSVDSASERMIIQVRSLEDKQATQGVFNKLWSALQKAWYNRMISTIATDLERPKK